MHFSFRSIDWYRFFLTSELLLFKSVYHFFRTNFLHRQRTELLVISRNGVSGTLFHYIFVGSKDLPYNLTGSKTSFLTTSPLYPCGKPCLRLALFSAIINGIEMESRSDSNPVGMLSVVQLNRDFRHICLNHSNSHISQLDWYFGNIMSLY